MPSIQSVKNLVCEYWNNAFAPLDENRTNVEKIDHNNVIVQWMYFDDKRLNLNVVLTTQFDDGLLFIVNANEKVTEMTVYNKIHTLQVI